MKSATPSLNLIVIPLGNALSSPAMSKIAIRIKQFVYKRFHVLELNNLKWVNMRRIDKENKPKSPLGDSLSKVGAVSILLYKRERRSQG